MDKKRQFFNGVHDGLPICIGYLSVSFAFGIFAVGCGLDGFMAVLISMTNVTSAGQLAGVPIIASGGALGELALTQLVINLRYALMSVSLSQKLDDDIRLRDRFLIAFVNTDEVFAVAYSKGERVKRLYMFGLILTPYLGWVTGTLLGVLAGNILPAVVTSALGVAIYAMFVAIVIPEARGNKSTALCVLLAVAIGCVLEYVPVFRFISDGFIIIISAVVASAVFAAVAPIDLGQDDEVQDE